MKKALLILIIILIGQPSIGQELKTYFLELSDTGIGFTKSEIELMISNYLEGKNSMQNGIGNGKHYLSKYEPNNGYLSIIGAYEGSEAMTFWNVSDGSKLIGYTSEDCGPICDHNIIFYLKTKNHMTRLDLNHVLPTITLSDFMDVPAMKRDGIDVTQVAESFYSTDLIYNLPSKGKNIIVESQFNDLDVPSELGKYNLGWKIELVWNDGTFIKN